MKIHKAYKVEIVPNKGQVELFNKCFGVARFTYNWGLEQRINAYKKDKKSLSFYEQHKILNSLKETQFPWMYDVSKCVPQEALRNVDDAFKKFFKGLKNKVKGFPNFKSKHNYKNSFKISYGQGLGYAREHSSFSVSSTHIRLAKIGHVRLKEKGYIPTGARYLSVAVSKKAGKYFVSVNCEESLPDIVTNPSTVIGIDVGSKTLVVCSNKQSFENPKTLYKHEKELSHVQRNVSRKKKGSNNRKKAQLKLQKKHYRIACIRNDNLHKITSKLVRTKPRYFVIEDLNIEGMVKNHKLAKTIQDCSWGEFRRQMEYKSKWYGSEIINADRFYPSSKRCHNCGNIKTDLTLADRVYICEKCGYVEDRDYNASLNLEDFGLSTLGLRGIKACGESVRLQEKYNLEAVSMKQELSNDKEQGFCNGYKGC